MLFWQSVTMSGFGGGVGHDALKPSHFACSAHSVTLLQTIESLDLIAHVAPSQQGPSDGLKAEGDFSSYVQENRCSSVEILY